MGIFEQLSSPEAWQAFLAYKRDMRHLTRKEDAELEQFIREEGYRPVVSAAASGAFPIPELKLIRKSGSSAKRAVYLYPYPENTVLKLMTFLLLRKYDAVFPDSLFSFRVRCGVNKAIRRLLSFPGIGKMYSYKADIRDYFNSIPVERLIPLMEETFGEEPECLALLSRLLRDRRVSDCGTVVERDKGVMAGTPFAVLLANLYLVALDREMEARGILYARYSDDIILFTGDAASRDRAGAFVEETLLQAGLSVNPEKRVTTDPGEPWSFLGIRYEQGEVDISRVSSGKLKAKIRRRARALKRWQVRKGATDEQAVKAFIRAMNRKFFNADSSNELTWARWYFPLLTTDRTLHEVDLFLQAHLRALYSGRNRKKNYTFTYAQMKALGYVSLRHEWYRYRADKAGYFPGTEG